MITLAAVGNMPANQIFWFLIIVGAACGMASVVFISLLFSWSLKETVDHALKLFIFAIITGASVYTIGNLALSTSQYSQADSQYQVSGWTLKRINNSITRIQFITETPARVYLEYENESGEIIPIFAETSTIKNTSHIFETNIEIQPTANIFVIVNGKRYKIVK